MVKPEIKFSFPAVLTVLICTDTVGTAFLCLAACVLHELGHIIVMLSEGRPPEKIIFYGGGIKLSGRTSKSLAAISGGVAVNFILFVVFYFFSPDYRLQLFGMINLITGIFNLIPIKPLDGYFFLEKLILRLFAPAAAIKFMHIAEITAGLLSAPLIILFFINGEVNFSSVIFLFYFFVVDILEKV